jgi:RNA polymerase sigma-70 factor (ECF subfamily)
MLNNEDAAVDAMQDTFVRLLRYQNKLGTEAPSSLLYRMATNVCLNKIRSSVRRPESPGDSLLERIACAGEQESKLTARSTLKRLFEKERASTRIIAVMHLLDGMTFEEVALEVNMSVSGVRKRLRPLRSKLKELEGVAL